jgi:polyisoprenoid-binding protein YceI
VAEQATNAGIAELVGQQTLWAIDPYHTLVEFSAKHMMVTTVRGKFGVVRGSLKLDETDLTNSAVDVEIETASITTGVEQRDTHLKSGDFLLAEQYPLITFKSTRIDSVGADRYKVFGDLTIRGTTREVALDATFNGQGTTPYGAEVAGFEATTTINRKDFGANWNVALETGGILVSENVKINLEVEAVKK